MTRRDMVHMVGLRASRLTPPQAAEAWYFLGRHLERLGDKDIPKFIDLLVGIRAGTIRGKQLAK